MLFFLVDGELIVCPFYVISKLTMINHLIFIASCKVCCLCIGAHTSTMLVQYWCAWYRDLFGIPRLIHLPILSFGLVLVRCSTVCLVWSDKHLTMSYHMHCLASNFKI